MKYSWYIQYYGSGCFLHNAWIDARSAAEAVKTLREREKVIEIVCCRRAVTW